MCDCLPLFVYIPSLDRVQFDLLMIIIDNCLSCSKVIREKMKGFYHFYGVRGKKLGTVTNSNCFR